MWRHTISDGHIHLFPLGSTSICIHCGASYSEAHAADPVLYPDRTYSVGYPLKLPPEANTHVHLGTPPADVSFHFYRLKPFTWLQVRMIKTILGLTVEQDGHR